MFFVCFFFQAEDGIRDGHVTGVQTCALPIALGAHRPARGHRRRGPVPRLASRRLHHGRGAGRQRRLVGGASLPPPQHAEAIAPKGPLTRRRFRHILAPCQVVPCSRHPNGGPVMIYEIRTYTLKTRSLAEVEKRYAEAYEYRKKYSPLAAFWHTEVGPLNEIVQGWPYPDLTERTRIRAEAVKDPNWPPKIGEFVLNQDVQLITPFPFIPEITPGTVGPIFEMRNYSLAPGSLPGAMKRWEGNIGERAKLSPIVLAGGTEFGQANRFVHIWAYQSMDQRLAVREQARKAGVWPPPGGGEELLAQSNKLMMPSSFSPLQ